MEHIYDVQLTWDEGRTGTIESSVLDEKIKIATPPEFPGGVAGIWSPEHLFVSAVSACFMTTFLAIAENSKLDFVSLKCNAEGKLEKAEGKFQITEITLSPVLVIPHEKDVDRAGRIMEKAEAACLISNSITSKVHLECKVEVAG